MTTLCKVSSHLFLQALSTVSSEQFRDEANFYSMLFVILGVIAASAVFMQVLGVEEKRQEGGEREGGGE